MSPFKIPAFFDLHLMRPNPEKTSMACCLQRSRSLVFFNSWYFLNCSDAVYFEPFPLTVMLPASFVKITFCCSIYSFPSTAFSIPVLKPSSHEIAQLLYSFTLSSNSRLYDTGLVDGANGMPSFTSCSSFFTNFFSFASVEASQSRQIKSHNLSFRSVIVRYDFIHVGS